MTWKRLKSIWRSDPSFQEPYQCSPFALSRLLYLSQDKAIKVYRYLQSTSPNSLHQKYENESINIITPFDIAYPNRLRHIYDPPWVLYALGDLQLLQSNRNMAVVGTRELTDYGSKAMQYILPPLVKKQVVIISGLAKGADTYAHKISLTYSGQTIAVLGSGFYHIYPRENEMLAKILAEKHLLLSEYPPHTPPKKWQFPMRNRLISGLSDIVFIVEAGERSGSLITAYQALEQGRDVKVLPGPIFSRYSKGTNQLIEEGASPVLSPEHLWLEWWDYR